MWFVKYLTILIYALGLCIVSLYISVIEFTDWFSDIVHEKDSIVNKSYDYIIGELLNVVYYAKLFFFL